MKFLPRVCTAALPFLLLACSSSEPDQSGDGTGSSEPTSKNDREPGPEPMKGEAEEPTIEGTWKSVGYGYMVDIRDDSFTFYQVTRDYCQEFPVQARFGLEFDALLKSTTVAEDNESLVTSLGGLKDPGMTFERDDELPTRCVEGLVPNIGDEGYVFDPVLAVQIFAQTYEEHYAFFDLEDVDWQELATQTLDRVDSETTSEELFVVLSELVAPLKDFHAQLEDATGEMTFSTFRKKNIEEIVMDEYVTENGLVEPFQEADFAGYEAYFEGEVDKATARAVSHFGAGLQSNATGTLIWGVNGDNLGYAFILSMNPEFYPDLEQTLGRMMGDFAETDGVMLDVRFNGGGSDEVSKALIGQFIESELHVFSKQARDGEGLTPLLDVFVPPMNPEPYLGPVVVLTSATTASAAETFALGMRERPQTTLLGEATGGGLSDILPKMLPNGVHYTLSNEFYLSPEGELFEGVGIPVDEEHTFFTEQQRDAGEDPGLDAALVLLKL